MSRDLMALLISFAYLASMVAVGEVARRRLGASREGARKFIHVAVGLWVFGTLTLFTSRWMAAVPAAVAVVANYLAARTRMLAATAERQGEYGTVWFPLSFLLLILFAWERPDAILGGMLAMTLGDAAAALIGSRWGKHRYQVWGGGLKTWEGSFTMAAVTAGALLLTGSFFPGLAEWSLSLAVLGAVVAAVAEALGPKGLDNLWVPLAVGAVIYGADRLPIGPLALGAVLALLIGMVGYVRGALSPSGVLGALLTGTLVFGMGGLGGGVALVAFFLSSTLLGRALRGRTRILEADYAKGGRRDMGQALANGGVAALAAALSFGTGQPAWGGALLGALATANADTWATELGGAFGRHPRLITTLHPVPAGTSGGVTGAGLVASLGGAGFVAMVAWAAGGLMLPLGGARLFAGAVLGGLVGSLADSLLGATVQAVYRCPDCGRETERTVHGCGARTQLLRGRRWITNDVVNLLATGVGAAVGYLMVG